MELKIDNKQMEDNLNEYLSNDYYVIFQFFE